MSGPTRSDGCLIAAPTVNRAITGDNSLIPGLDIDEARTLAAVLNSGTLPLPVRVVSSEEIPEPAPAAAIVA